jgi:anti-sigma factor RsiW
VRCKDLERVMEAMADGSLEPTAEDRAHLETCPRCRLALADARRIEQWLAAREQSVPPADFTTTVMSRIVRDTWQTERVIDIGFNLAVAAGIAVILAGAAGLAWSLGLLTVTIDPRALLGALDTEVTGRVMNQVQTVVVSAVLLTMALGLWWWAETAE